jgi:hypothetical protein
MKFKQDGQGVAEFVEETEEDIRKLTKARGKGGKGLHESALDAQLRGITPELVRQLSRKASPNSPDPSPAATSTERPARRPGAKER